MRIRTFVRYRYQCFAIIEIGCIPGHFCLPGNNKWGPTAFELYLMTLLFCSPFVMSARPLRSTDVESSIPKKRDPLRYSRCLGGPIRVSLKSTSVPFWRSKVVVTLTVHDNSVTVRISPINRQTVSRFRQLICDKRYRRYLLAAGLSASIFSAYKLTHSVDDVKTWKRIRVDWINQHCD